MTALGRGTGSGSGRLRLVLLLHVEIPKLIMVAKIKSSAAKDRMSPGVFDGVCLQLEATDLLQALLSRLE